MYPSTQYEASQYEPLQYEPFWGTGSHREADDKRDLAFSCLKTIRRALALQSPTLTPT